MVDPPGAGDHAAAVQRLVAEAQMLHDRLHRITIALALTEEMAAEIFDQAASTQSGAYERLHDQAQRARSTAAECRAFALRLESLRPVFEG